MKKSLFKDNTITETGASSAAPFSDDVFSSYLYTGNGSTQTINNGIDLAGKGGLVWLKGMSYGGSSREHYLFDTRRGSENFIVSNSPAAQTTNAGTTCSFTNTGATLGPQGTINGVTESYVAWSFRKAPKFFDVVTYTGTGSPRTINHSLGVSPGMIVVKSTSTTSEWSVYHMSLGEYKGMFLNTVAASTDQYATWNTTQPTATQFTVGTNANVNANGQTYVAYLFAHDPDTVNGVVQCGSFSITNTSDVPAINLGWEPQYVMYKPSSTSGEWRIFDSSRGVPTGGTDNLLRANRTDAEVNVSDYLTFNSTGFTQSANIDTGPVTYIYLAIRRSNKPPTTGTQVYNAIARTGTGAVATVTGLDFAPDLTLTKARTASTDVAFWDRLRGTLKPLKTSSTSGELSDNGGDNGGIKSYDMAGITVGMDGGYGLTNTSSTAYINHFFKRAPGVFDIVCYTGTGSGAVVKHSLGVVPELIIAKSRSTTSDWYGCSSAAGGTQGISINYTSAALFSNTPVASLAQTYFDTSTLFSSAGQLAYISGVTYVAYLFATKAGISKVGSYTGNGTSQTINCGFSTSARFVLIKKTSGTGDWLVGDSTRGIVAASDPRLSLNTSAAEVTNEDWLDPDSTGFIVNQTTCDANANGATYIYLAFS